MRNMRGFTLIELLAVVVIIGVLAAIGLPLYKNMQDQARVAQVKSTMHTVQVTVEDFASRNDGVYPQTSGDTTLEGNHTLQGLMPGAGMPQNPFTQASTNLDITNAAGAAPATDPAGGVSLNVTQSNPAAAFDRYEIVGADGRNTTLSLVLSNS